MSLKDYLKKIVDLKIFPSLKNINNNKISLVNFTREGDTYIDKTTNRININITVLDDRKKYQLLKDLPKLVQENIDILEEHFRETEVDYREQINRPENVRLIKYFSTKIPNTDLPILKASLYLKYLLDTKRSEEHTSELQSHSFISYAVFCLKKKKN